MKNTRWQAWETIGLLWTLAAGNLLHFVYQWTGESTVAGLFAAVNESTWEHMKLLAVPWVLFSLVEYIALRTDGVAAPRAAGLLAGLAAIPTLFYTYKGIVGQAAGRRRLDGGGAAGAAWDMGGVFTVYLPAAGAGDIYRPGDGDKGDRIRGTFYKVQRFMGRANQPPFFLDRGDGIRYNRGENHPGGRRRHEKNDRA